MALRLTFTGSSIIYVSMSTTALPRLFGLIDRRLPEGPLDICHSFKFNPVFPILPGLTCRFRRSFQTEFDLCLLQPCCNPASQQIFFRACRNQSLRDEADDRRLKFTVSTCWLFSWVIMGEASQTVPMQIYKRTNFFTIYTPFINYYYTPSKHMHLPLINSSFDTVDQ